MNPLPCQPPPRGYVGSDHMTIGADVLAVKRSLVAIASNSSQVAHILGETTVARLRTVEEDGWYPIGWLLEMMDIIEEKIGSFGLLKMGRVLFKAHEHRTRDILKCCKDVVYSFDTMYRHANRGENIGGWKVLEFSHTRAELEKTTPHHCMMEEGILAQALKSVGAAALLSQRQCRREGSDACVFVIEPNGIDGGRWNE